MASFSYVKAVPLISRGSKDVADWKQSSAVPAGRFGAILWGRATPIKEVGKSGWAEVVAEVDANAIAILPALFVVVPANEYVAEAFAISSDVDAFDAGAVP
jgi:hypothetical protein